MAKIYVINYEYANEKVCFYERGAKCAFIDLNKAKERLAELTEGLKDEMLEKFDEDDIVEEKDNMSYSIYWDYRYSEYHTDYWIDEVDIEE